MSTKKLVALIDEYCNYRNGQILIKDDGAFSCTLNQTNIKSNANKFYIMQIISTGQKYIWYVRYGRIGERGVVSHDEYTSELDAIRDFKKQFRTKTGNSWVLN